MSLPSVEYSAWLTHQAPQIISDEDILAAFDVGTLIVPDDVAAEVERLLAPKRRGKGWVQPSAVPTIRGDE